MKSTIAILLVVITAVFFSSFTNPKAHLKFSGKPPQDTIFNPASGDTLGVFGKSNRILHKKNAHASYYHDKFNGRRTASGTKFNNDKYTAAHRKFAFGTILKVTNEANGKFVIVEITDRGPFTKGREIDLSRRAFMDITGNRGSGVLKVTIEIIK